MKYPSSRFFALVVVGLVAAQCMVPSSVVAQSSNVSSSASVAAISPVKTGAVPSLVSYPSVLQDASGRAVTSITGVTFLLYKDSQGGAPLWMETQNVIPDKTGHYAVQLGSTSSAGLPSEMFMSGEARWLGVQIAAEAEQPRVLLVAVPYAMKAADAETVGGLPPSAFVLAAPASASSANAIGTTPSTAASSSSSSAPPPASSNVTTTGGTVNAIPLFTTATNIQNSIVTQTGTTAVNVAGKLNLPSTGIATATGGKNSRPETMVASSFSSTTSAAVNQTFQWQAEPVGNNTIAPSGTLNLLFGSGTSNPTETGVRIASNGQFTFASGQTFPGTGTITGVTTASSSGLSGGGTSGSLALSLLNTCSSNQVLQWNGTAWICATVGGTGTITGVTAGTDLTGGGTSGNVTLNLNTAALQTSNDARYAQLNANNVFTKTMTFAAGQTFPGTGSGTVTSVGLAAPATDFTVSGSPVTSAGTLNFAWNVAPSSTNTAKAIVKRDNTGSFATYSISASSILASAISAANLVASDGTTGAATIQGYANATSGSSWGVYGVTNSSASNAYGVVGYATSSTGTPDGVYGVASSAAGVGVFGQDGGESATGAGLSSALFLGSPLGAGVWGDGGSSTAALHFGVAGTVDDGIGGIFVNNSPSGQDTLYVRALNSATQFPFIVFTGKGGYCDVDSVGNLNCSGSKNAVVPLDGGKRQVAMSAVEAPQNWFEDAGEGQLVHGATAVTLDPDFVQTVNTGTNYKVFPVPNGECKGLYVTNKTATSFEVRELGGGTSSVAFDYRIMVLRKNYENVRFAEHTDPRKIMSR